MNIAREYVEAGLALVKIPAGRKGPTVPGWNKRENIITDIGQESRISGNIGLAHVYCTPRPTMALDIDDIDFAKNWLSMRGVCLDALLGDDNAVHIVSGRPGRYKLLYRLPVGCEPLPTKQVSMSNEEMGIEFRCASGTGLTVQDVLPPSIHPKTKKPYSWGGKGDWREIPEIPAELLRVWRELIEPRKQDASLGLPSADQVDGEEVDPETIKNLRSALLSMRSDEYQLWINMGLALKSLGDVGRGLWLEWSLTSEKSQKDPLALSRTWEGLQPIRISYRSIFREAQERGWVNPAKNYSKSIHGSATDAEQDAPQPLPSRLQPVRAIDTDILPSTVRNAVVDISERLSCPADYVATPLLLGAGAILGNRACILPKQNDDTWKVYPTLWGAIVGPPGSMKTPAQHQAFKPIRHIEEIAEQGHAAAMSQYKISKKQYDKDLKGFNSGKSQTIPIEPDEPKRPRLVVNDTTYQALGEILAANPRGVLVHGDELSGLLHSLDAAGQEAARGFYLSGWGGNADYTFDRVGRGSIRLSNFALSVFGGFQPDKVQHYVRSAQVGSSQNDGLLQRFQLLVWPDFNPEFTLVDRVPDQQAIEKMHTAMLALRGTLPQSKENQLEAIRLRFSATAQAIFNKWYIKNETYLRCGTLPPAEHSHLAKYRSLVPALALLFHLLEGREGDVCEHCLGSAIKYALYLKSHAQRVYAAVHSKDTTSAYTLARKILNQSIRSGFTLRSVYTHGWSGLSSKEQVGQAVNLLTELNWLSERQVETRGKPKVVYDIDPQVFVLGEKHLLSVM